MKHFEFWPPRLFETPYYLYLLTGLLKRRLPVKSLAKANFALDHGEIGIGSKVQTQFAFNQAKFLPTQALANDLSDAEKTQQIARFGELHGYPIILKPDIGSVGKGLLKLHKPEEVDDRIKLLSGPYVIQQFTPHNAEYGVFFVRSHGQSKVTGINCKHFPTVVGDGERTLRDLAHNHERYTRHWQSFLQYSDLNRVPDATEVVQLSFIGSHTLGCKFTDDSHLITTKLEQAVFEVCNSQPGFNFGRLDVKAANEEAFLAGDFVVIEINGIASLPTNMFDPDHSLAQGYRIFLQHGRYLLDIANEHRDIDMPLLGYREIVQRVRNSSKWLNDSHLALITAQEQAR